MYGEIHLYESRRYARRAGHPDPGLTDDIAMPGENRADQRFRAIELTGRHCAARLQHQRRVSMRDGIRMDAQLRTSVP
jgi:hypothetical protein